MAGKACTILVVGDASAGKSSLIEAAIVDAARSQSLPPKGPSSVAEIDTHGVEFTVPADPSQGLWMRHELRAVASSSAADRLATGLWWRWLRPPQSLSPPATRREATFSVTVVHGTAIQHWPSSWPSSVVFVEVSTAVLLGLRKRTSMPISSLTAQRLEWLIAAASGLIVCLPVSRPLVQESLNVLMVLLEAAAARPTGPPAIRLACTLADMDLGERLLAETPSLDELLDPDRCSSKASEIIAGDINKRYLRDAMGSLAAVDLCSSFGLLRSSVSVNLDLAVPPGYPAAQEPVTPILPLWPRSDDLDRLVPSWPARLDDWEPLGVFNCAWSTVIG